MKSKNSNTVARRRSLALLVSGAAGLTAKQWPSTWTRPVVQAVMLPAHAQTSVSLSCVAEPPSGSAVDPQQQINVTVTVSPNPGAGQPVTSEGFCDGSSAFTSTLFTDAAGQVFDSGDLGFCSGGQLARIRYSFGGVTDDCFWTIQATEENCLVHGTPVLVGKGGYSPIESLSVGDVVAALGSGDRLGYSIVTLVRTHHVRNGYFVINDEIRITNDHPVMVECGDDCEWRRVGSLQVGDRIKSTDGAVEVTTLVRHAECVPTVYLETTDDHFIVAGGGRHYVVKSKYTGDASRTTRAQADTVW